MNLNKMRHNPKYAAFCLKKICIWIIDVEVVEMEKYSKVSNDQLIFSIQELKDKGLSYYKINQLVKQGILIKLNKKYYENTNFDGEESDFYYAYAYVPNGVICLLSAAVYYNLSTYRPDAIDIAIPRKARVSTLPEWPELKIYYFTEERFSLYHKYETYFYQLL